MNRELVMKSGFREEIALIDEGKRPWCGVVIEDTEFRDMDSTKEFHISGLCQACQDGFF